MRELKKVEIFNESSRKLLTRFPCNFKEFLSSLSGKYIRCRIVKQHFIIDKEVKRYKFRYTK